MTEPPIILAHDWYNEVIALGVDPTQPGIYEWQIEDVGLYIGQYTRSTRPRGEYGKNLVNLLNGRPYRKGKPDKFRTIHHQLAQAVREGRRITLFLVENVAEKSARNQRERELIAERRRAAAQGGLPVLNSN